MAFEHVPVMIAEVLEALKLGDEALVVDGTLGLGGYSEVFLRERPGWKVIGVDQDDQARALAIQRLAPWGNRFTAAAGNFRDLSSICRSLGYEQVDAVILDLGVSNLQITEGVRGFSFREEGPLDMRMNPASKLTAAEILNHWSQKELTRIFQDFGEERFARAIARKIVSRRDEAPLERTGELVEVIRSALPAAVMRKSQGHPARRVFQALRIVVNDELGALSDGLEEAKKLLALEGRLVVVTYHSLEDRMVKRAMKQWSEELLGELEPRRGRVPSEEEVARNPKSRSARLRGFIRRNTERNSGREGPWRH